jgi:hypothetical protein
MKTDIESINTGTCIEDSAVLKKGFIEIKNLISKIRQIRGQKAWKEEKRRIPTVEIENRTNI